MDKRPKREKTTSASYSQEVSSIEWEIINISEEEEDLIHRMYKLVGDRWGLIAGRIPGRKAEEIERNEFFLIEKILCSYEKALQMLNSEENACEANAAPTIAINGSPRSEVLDHEDKHKEVYKKRKTMPRWTEKVKICSGTTGLEGSLDDGYSWRKYGQKDILGAKFPRGYYRCTHRHGQGCLATKQVQKSDEDPTIFEVTYRGRHTCNNQAYSLNKVSSSSKKKMRLGGNHNHKVNYKPQGEEEEEEGKMEYSLDTFFTFGSELEVKMEDIFPSENHLMENFSSADFVSPATSESNLLCLSPCHLETSVGIGHNLQTPESDVTEIVSASTSLLTNSSLLDLDLLFDEENFQTNSPFNTTEFFSS
ncbi:putative WRKY transcription factor 53 [Senna tora]|uniref:Putative WRKY transcription factor 53 n=1 Tax=Senna tora TaxID=362788 RepID=A0A834WNV4_9FABA|nr:putative WRKY transcription factor 53 [Senna tora]